VKLDDLEQLLRLFAGVPAQNMYVLWLLAMTTIWLGMAALSLLAGDRFGAQPLMLDALLPLVPVVLLALPGQLGYAGLEWQAALIGLSVVIAYLLTHVRRAWGQWLAGICTALAIACSTSVAFERGVVAYQVTALLTVRERLAMTLLTALVLVAGALALLLARGTAARWVACSAAIVIAAAATLAGPDQLGRYAVAWTLTGLAAIVVGASLFVSRRTAWTRWGAIGGATVATATVAFLLATSTAALNVMTVREIQRPSAPVQLLGLDFRAWDGICIDGGWKPVTVEVAHDGAIAVEGVAGNGSPIASRLHPCHAEYRSWKPEVSAGAPLWNLDQTRPGATLWSADQTFPGTEQEVHLIGVMSPVAPVPPGPVVWVSFERDGVVTNALVAWEYVRTLTAPA
jgi:hypothetical protein